MACIQDIQRLIALGHADRFIARSVKCRRTKVAEVRKAGPLVPAAIFAKPVEDAPPFWTERVDWESVLKDIGEGF